MGERARGQLDQLLTRYPDLAGIRGTLAQAYEQIRTSLGNGGTLFVCGNGGSAADAEHIVGELMKGFLLKRPLTSSARRAFDTSADAEAPYLAAHLQHGLRAVALAGQTPLATAIANDTAADMVYAQQLFVLGTSGDVLLGISTSGNARNVLMAAKVAKTRQLTVIGLTGADGGELRQNVDTCICVPEVETYKIQERHLPIYHALCAMLEDSFFGDAHGTLG